MAELPKMMRAAALDRFGGPEVLTLHRLPVPVPGRGEILIAVHTAGVGQWDADVRDGWNPGTRRPFPIVLGYDGSGTVVAKGSAVRRFREGDQVYAYSWDNPKGGFYAEYVAVPASKAARKPRRLDLREAGAIPITGLTALQGVERLRLRKGDAVAVHGASGGVGSMAVQFARIAGARVFATASGSDGVKLARRLGAEQAVDGKRGDVTAAARRFAPDGFAAVLGFAGGDPLRELAGALRRGGQLVYPNGVEPAPRKRKGIRVIGYDSVSGPREFARLEKAVEAARLRVVIAAAFPLARARRAHERLAKGHVLGKIVLKVAG
jgi:NADPH:quinone reductase-like Zn-dependent oxidoreductase